MIRPTRIDNVLIDVPDLEQAVGWYAKNVGLDVIVAGPQVAVLHTADHDRPGIVLRQSEDASHGTVWFEVPDATAVAEHWNLPVFTVTTGLCVELPDPWGNTIGFTDYSNIPRH